MKQLIIIACLFAPLAVAFGENQDFEECLRIYKSERTCKSMGVANKLAGRKGQKLDNETDGREFQYLLKQCIQYRSESVCRKEITMHRLSTKSEQLNQYQMRKEQEVAEQMEKRFQEQKENWKSNCDGARAKQEIIECFGKPDYQSKDSDGSSYLRFSRGKETKHIHLEGDWVRSYSESEID